jgi:hypothetical protein
MVLGTVDGAGAAPQATLNGKDTHKVFPPTLTGAGERSHLLSREMTS